VFKQRLFLPTTQTAYAASFTSHNADSARNRYWLAPAGASLAAVAGAETAGPLCAAPLTAAAPA